MELMCVGYNGVLLLEVVCELLVGVIYLGVVMVVVVVVVLVW